MKYYALFTAILSLTEICYASNSCPQIKNCGENAPPYDELIDSKAPSGLNVENITKRQVDCRMKGVGNDISTTLENYRSNLGIILVQKKKIEGLKKLQSDHLQKLQSAEKKLNEYTYALKNSKNISKKDLNELKDKIKENEEEITKYKTAIKEESKKINEATQILDITIETSFSMNKSIKGCFPSSDPDKLPPRLKK